MRTDLPLQVWSAPHRRDTFVVVSFFTQGFYTREAFELLRGCQYFSLPYHFVQVKDEKDWLISSNRKPSFLREMSDMFPNRPILWLDADARVRKLPLNLFHLDVPIAYCELEKDLPCDATVYLGVGKQRNVFLDEWAKLVKDDPFGAKLPPEQAAVGAPTQFYFERAFQNLGIHPTHLPLEYCWLYDLSADRTGKPAKVDVVPVIEQMQANRIARRMS